MSIKSAEEFCSVIGKDESLASKLADLNGKELTEEIFNEKILPIAKEMGYDFTYLDFIEICKKSKELREDQLADVAGGGRSGGGTRVDPGEKDDLQIDILSNGHLFWISYS